MSDFYEDLDGSELDNDFYYRIIPHLKSIRSATKEEQQKGIDKVLTLSNGTEVTVEEKRRKKDYNDFALEIASGQRLGWLYKCQAQWLRYHVVPTGKDSFINMLQLQLAWSAEKEKWLKENFRATGITYRNGISWESTNVCVTASSLFYSLDQQHYKLQKGGE